MLSAIRIIFLSLIMSLLLVTSSIAGTILYGVVRIDNDVYLSRYNVKQSFPSSLYRFMIKAYDLKYDRSVSKVDRVKDLSIFTLKIDARLILISFDKNSGIVKFKLKLIGGDWLNYTGLSFNIIYFETGGTNLKGGGSLKLADGSEPEFIIEGKLEIVNGKYIWVSFNNNKYFDIKIDNIFNFIELKLLHDFPVIVTSKS